MPIPSQAYVLPTTERGRLLGVQPSGNTVNINLANEGVPLQ